MCRRDVDRLKTTTSTSSTLPEIRIKPNQQADQRPTEDTIVKLFDDVKQASLLRRDKQEHPLLRRVEENEQSLDSWEEGHIPCSLWNALFELFYTDHGPYDPRNYLADVEKTLNYLEQTEAGSLGLRSDRGSKEEPADKRHRHSLLYHDMLQERNRASHVQGRRAVEENLTSSAPSIRVGCRRLTARSTMTTSRGKSGLSLTASRAKSHTRKR